MRTHVTIGALWLCSIVFAQPGTITEHLKVDQFGYPQGASKICVINNPQAGFDYDAGDFYTPGNTLQLIKASDHSVVMSGNIMSWHAGATYDQSGDKIWWFDFSGVTTPGTYYVYDPANDKRSFEFSIADSVYVEVLKQAVRMFYYQRSGFAKTSTYAYDWTDAASHLGSQQDLDCRLATNPAPGTSKQLQGGWFDAGDYNKYVNFAYEPIHDLCLAYLEHPGMSKFIPTPCVKTITNAYDSGYGTFRQAVSCAADGDTITIDLPQGDTLFIADTPLSLNKNLVIQNGNGGQAPVYCATSSMGMEIASGKIVHLYQLSLSGSGSGILNNSGILHLHDVRFNPAGISGPVLVNESQATMHGTVEIRQ